MMNVSELVCMPSTIPNSTSISPMLVPVPPSGMSSSVTISMVVPRVSPAMMVMFSTV